MLFLPRRRQYRREAASYAAALINDIYYFAFSRRCVSFMTLAISAIYAR